LAPIATSTVPRLPAVSAGSGSVVASAAATSGSGDVDGGPGGAVGRWLLTPRDATPGARRTLDDDVPPGLDSLPGMTSAPLPTDRLTELREAVEREMPGLRRDLETLVRIPSVSAAAFDQSHVDASAEAVAGLLRGEGMQDVMVLREGGAPAVVGHLPGPQGSPTVLLYAHHDVQPPGDDADWTTPPFEPTERGGRLYGRGAADDKAGVVAHLAALRAHGGRPPVGVTVFVEGEEESGSPSLGEILRRHRDRLAADVLVLADSNNWKIGVPALTTSLRGLVEAFVEVRTLDHAVHSGMYGGAVMDALTALVRLLGCLHDENGDVAVPGLQETRAADLDLTEEQLRQDGGVLDGVQLVGTGSLTSRLWTKPALTVVGIDAPSTAKASNTLVPKAKAKLSLRVAPGQDPRQAYEALSAHLRAHAPWGAQVEVTLKETGSGFQARADGPVYDAARAAFADAWGTEPVDMGVGGSIPFIAEFAEIFPDAAILVTGVEDPDTRAHGADESLHLGEFAAVCLAEAVLLERLGQG
jgi:acetylornithine deacetylase/succinyl-diaminopimelate desuccinylase-like protein